MLFFDIIFLILKSSSRIYRPDRYTESVVYDVKDTII